MCLRANRIDQSLPNGIRIEDFAEEQSFSKGFIPSGLIKCASEDASFVELLQNDRRRDGESKNEIRFKGDNAFDIWGVDAPEFGNGAGSLWVNTEVGGGDEALFDMKCVECFGDAWGKGDDA